MNVVSELFIYLLISAFLQNVIFTRTLGVSRIHIHLTTPRKILLFGGCLTLVAFLSSFLGFLVSWLFRELQWPAEARPLCFLVCISLVYIGLVFGLKYAKNIQTERMKVMLIDSSFNCAVLGAMLISATQMHSLARTVGFSIGTGIGFTLATLLIYTGRRRLALSDVPRAFRGLPIGFLYIGLISLSIYGLIGHQLAS